MKNIINILIPVYFKDLQSALYSLKLFLAFDFNYINDIHFYYNNVPNNKMNILLNETINIAKFTNNFSFTIKNEKIPPAKICYEYFNNNKNSYVIVLNDDIIVKYNDMLKIINLLNNSSPNEYPYIWFPKVDYFNKRNYKDYFWRPINFNKALELSKIYGEYILGFLCYKNSEQKYFLYKTNIGFGFYAVHTSKIPKKAFDLLKNFEVGVRGYDKLLADYFEDKYLMTNVCFIHLPSTDKFLDGEIWSKINNKSIIKEVLNGN